VDEVWLSCRGLFLFLLTCCLLAFACLVFNGTMLHSDAHHTIRLLFWCQGLKGPRLGWAKDDNMTGACQFSGRNAAQAALFGISSIPRVPHHLGCHDWPFQPLTTSGGPFQ
jgi:hypothetical protein